MKKYFSFLCLILSALSCDSPSDNLTTKSIPDETSIKKVIEESDSQKQKILYVTLSPSEKHAIWTRRIDFFIEENSLSTPQKSHLLAFVKHLKPTLFEDSQENLVEIKRIENEWAPKAFTLFEKDELKLLLGSLNFVPTKSSIDFSSARLPSPPCGCNGDSFFDCSACNGDDPCGTKDSGCGFLFYYSCNKSCFIPPN